MKKMKTLMRLIGISLALLLLLSMNACIKTQAEGADMQNENVKSKEFDTTEDTVEIPCEGYTLSLEGADLIFRNDDSIIAKDRIITIATARSSPFVSSSYLIGNRELVAWFLSNVLVCDRVQLNPTTWEELEGERPGTLLTDYHYVSFGSKSNLYLYFRSSNWQLIVRNEKTGDIYASEPGVVDSAMYHQFIIDYK